MLRSALLLLALAAGVNAECPNACSGHGVCSAYDTCVCHRNFEGADCSLRTCPFGSAHVDTPKGDLDGSSDALDDASTTVIYGSTKYPFGTQEQFPNMTNSAGQLSKNTAHYYMECSNKGICDRKAGECECFAGYDGSACQRASCPNDCSGHGTCEHVQTLAANDFDNIYELWDAELTMGCACDAGYSGADCSTLDCKYGIDPLYVDDAATARVEEVRYSVRGTTLSGTYALKFYDVFGEDYVTDPIKIGATCDTVTDTLEALPGTVIPQGSIVCDADVTANTASAYKLTFTGNPGYLKQLDLDYYLDGQRSTLTSTTDPKIRIFSPGRNGEFVDYFATQCAGVKATIGGSLSTSNRGYGNELDDDATNDVVTVANELNSGYYLDSLSASEVKALKICLGDADGETSNNIEVYNWDYGSMYAIDDTVAIMDSYPHAIKLVDTTPADNYNGGYYYLTWWAPDDAKFILANAPPTLSDEYSANTEYYVYTTDGVVERVILDNYSEDGELTYVTAIGNVEPRITAWFEEFTNVLYTSYDVSCESDNTYVEPCLEKGDLLFIIDSKYMTTSYDATDAVDSVTTGDVAGHVDVTDITASEYATGQLYTIEKIYNVDPTSTTWLTEDRFRIVVDKNINFRGMNLTTYFDDGSVGSVKHGVVNLFKFAPATTGNYEFVSQCSNRGACDTDAGVCECFKGYTGDDCTTQSSLAV